VNCDYQVPTTDKRWKFCRHPYVHASGSIVPVAMCESCRYGGELRAGYIPRPMPDRVPVQLSVATTTQQVKRYSQAVVRWVAAGCPTRSDQETLAIYQLCRNGRCGKYVDTGKIEKCGSCGCRISQDGTALLNKIRMATEWCPEGLWDATATADEDRLKRIRRSEVDEAMQRP